MKRMATALTSTILALSATAMTCAYAATTSSSTYTIQPGDTLYKISVSQGVSLSSLESDNPQIPNYANLQVGEQINIPTADITASTPATTTYTVQPGDTLYKIATTNGISLSVLESANPQITDFTNLLIGQQLNIPAVSATNSSNTTSTNSTSASTSSIPANSTTTTTSAATATVNRQDLVNYAETFIGIPYVWGGSSPNPGFDCSGYTQYVFAHFGISLDRQSHDQATQGTAVTESQLQPGDLLFFANTDSYAYLYANHVTHVGIYIGNGAMIVDSSSKGVTIINHVFSNSYYMSHYYDARNVIG